MKRYPWPLPTALAVVLPLGLLASAQAPAVTSRPTLFVRAADDFEVTSNGSNSAWSKADWVALHRRQPDGLRARGRNRQETDDRFIDELPILVPSNGGAFMGWRPWHYENDRKTRKATAAIGGAKESGGLVQSWSAEFFISYAFFRGLMNQPPKSGTRWRANFYRMDCLS
jgi:hypothetical protein